MIHGFYRLALVPRRWLPKPQKRHRKRSLGKPRKMNQASTTICRKCSTLTYSRATHRAYTASSTNVLQERLQAYKDDMGASKNSTKANKRRAHCHFSHAGCDHGPPCCVHLFPASNLCPIPWINPAFDVMISLAQQQGRSWHVCVLKYSSAPVMPPWYQGGVMRPLLRSLPK